MEHRAALVRAEHLEHDAKPNLARLVKDARQLDRRLQRWDVVVPNVPRKPVGSVLATQNRGIVRTHRGFCRDLEHHLLNIVQSRARLRADRRGRHIDRFDTASFERVDDGANMLRQLLYPRWLFKRHCPVLLS